MTSMDAAIIEREALLLGEAERPLLADRLLESVTVDSGDRLRAWAQESENRLAAFRSGILKADDAGLVIARLRSQLCR